MRLLTKLAIAAIPLAAIGIGTEAFMRSDYFKEKDEIICSHKQEVSILNEEHTFLENMVTELEIRNKNLEQAISEVDATAEDAKTKLREATCKQPEYDYERFIRLHPEAAKYFPYILEATERHKKTWPVDPLFILAIVKQETDFGKAVVSNAGALGDFQFIESTARRYGLPVNEPASWKKARTKQYNAVQKLKEAAEIRSRLDQMLEKSIDFTLTQQDIRRDIKTFMDAHTTEILRYNTLRHEARTLQEDFNKDFIEYKTVVKEAMDRANAKANMVMELDRYEDMLYRTIGTAPRTKAQRERDKRRAYDQEVYTFDPRLALEPAINACVKHAADLQKQFNGDYRKTATAYNAGVNRMLDAGGNGEHGIPFIYETVNYINQVMTNFSLFRREARPDHKTREDLEQACYQYPEIK